nr:MAG TPA: hypothetical protein [Caudoviricetes sp.]
MSPKSTITISNFSNLIFILRILLPLNLCTSLFRYHKYILFTVYCQEYIR